MNSRILFFSLLFLLPSFSAHAAKQSFPFVAEASANKVNVRAGGSENFEKIYTYNHGDQVVVIDKNFSWYKVKLPKEAKSFVTDKYVKLISDQEGEITADKVNVRAGATVNNTVLGQLKMGDHISILKKQEGWYQIVPIEESYGWVAENLLAFKSKDVAKYEPPQAKSSPAAKSPAGQTLTGILKAETNSVTGATYYLEIDHRPAYMIQGPQIVLNDFRNYSVNLEGSLQKDFLPPALPILTVSKIQMVF